MLLVGGGSIIAPAKLSGVREIIRPPFFSVANAVGAAMAKGQFLRFSYPRSVALKRQSQSREKWTPSSSWSFDH